MREISHSAATHKYFNPRMALLEMTMNNSNSHTIKCAGKISYSSFTISGFAGSTANQSKAPMNNAAAIMYKGMLKLCV